ncbi:MAG TPA: iron-sulfur cluster assembly accessory protein [Pantanalinema sp.]
MVNLSPEATSKLMVTVTPEAATHIKEALGAQSRSDLALRLYIKPGGCNGYGFGMGLDSAKAGDLTFDHEGIPVVIDPHSAPYLEGAEVGYRVEAMGGGFTITSPNTTSGGGCGSGGCGCGSAKSEEAPAAKSGGCGSGCGCG